MHRHRRSPSQKVSSGSTSSTRTIQSPPISTRKTTLTSQKSTASDKSSPSSVKSTSKNTAQTRTTLSKAVSTSKATATASSSVKSTSRTSSSSAGTPTRTTLSKAVSTSTATATASFSVSRTPSSSTGTPTRTASKTTSPTPRVDCNKVEALVNSFDASKSDEATNVIKLHNLVRAYVSRQINFSLPSLEWNQSLANGSFVHLAVGGQQCTMKHVVTPTEYFPKNVGQNLYMYWSSSGKAPTHPFVAATSSWINQECRNYNGSDMTTFASWGHYSQVLAPQSTMIGCSMYNCTGVNKGTYLVDCDYFNPGNVVINNRITIGNGY
ncbi:CAP domain-containing protein [Obelidium mucronatum]|nr:CAP domain-containing protein [Obelidium mucronatum]